MRIYEMTATFGKLEHETLTLQPGLNIIHAPNEWGKSTWCAFLMAMLYGLDTRAKTTKTALAAKERYAPWSGSPMAGRIDLCWEGRDITIERRTKGRTPLGEFRAYETKTGVLVPELTAANCGQLLLGVEQSVYRRAGFIRLSDLPVTQDDALRRRLNALVTTGDESGDGERLARELRELKNRCRYNRSGLIPQAEGECHALEEKLEELDALEMQSKKLKTRVGEVKSWLNQLENHRDALIFAAAERDAGKVAQARDARDRAEKNLLQAEQACANIPSREEAEGKLRQLRNLREQLDSAHMEATLMGREPDAPKPEPPFLGESVESAGEMVRRDRDVYQDLAGSKPGKLLLFLGLICMAVAMALVVLAEYGLAGALAVAAVVLLILRQGKRRERKRRMAALEEKYGSGEPDKWLADWEVYAEKQNAYELALVDYRATRGDLDIRVTFLQKQRDSLCGEQSPEQVMKIWQQTVSTWDAYYDARREAARAEELLGTLQAMAKSAKRPAMEDPLTYTEKETARLLSDALAEQQRLQNRLGQYQGRMEVLGDREALEKQLAKTKIRLNKLEDTYAALSIAQETLMEARLELQRRFAPRLSRRAEELLGTMTGGRYDRMTLDQELSVHAGAGAEDTLREAMWRSDGTVDQLYLALRLAVAEALTKDAPLVLDDALVRFDDERLKAALAILKQEAEHRQVILFSCQSREQDAV